MISFFMRKGGVACASMIFGLILLFVAFLGPWYTINGSGALGVNYNVGFYLTKMEAKGTIPGQDISLSMSYTDVKENAQMVGVNIESFAVINTAMYLTLCAIITALIAVIGIIAFIFNKGKPKTMKWLGGGFGFLTFFLALVPALYVMSTGFAENSNGFWFSQSVLGVTVSGGPGYAWYLMMVVAIISVISAVAILLKKIAPEATSPETLPPATNK
jgi:hypothetical protein